MTASLAVVAALAGAAGSGAAAIPPPPAALAALGAAIAAYPRDPDPPLRRARLWRDAGVWSEARRDYLRALALVPDRPGAWAELGLVALEAADADAFERALAGLGEAASAGPDDFLALGKRLWDAGRGGEALATWARAMARFPADVRFVRNCAFGHYARGEHAQAERLYRAALALAPQAPGLRTDLAWALLALGRNDEAERLCREVLATSPDDAAARAILARLGR